MNKKVFLPIVGLILFATLISVASANISVSIEVKDSGGTSISGEIVPINTDAYVYGYYEDLDGSASASATMEVYFDDDPSSGPGWQYKATLFSGIVNDEDTILRTYTMTELGYYQFRWTCETTVDYGQVRTTVGPVIPEPGTLASLIMAFAALGLVARKRFHK